MRTAIRVGLAVIVLTIGPAGHLFADQLDDAAAAYERKDYATAVRLFRDLAEQGNAIAQYNLGAMYARGQGVPQDRKTAGEWYRKAAAKRDVRAAQSKLFEDPSEAEGNRVLAGLGNPDAQYNVGLMYSVGQGGVPQDYAEAIKWYHKAAEQGHARAQHNLGRMYDAGEGMPQDYAEAVKWYGKAAEQGHAGAQNNLCLKYVDGKGVQQDYVQAYKWCELAAAHLSDRENRDKAQKNRGFVAGKMTPAQIAEAQKLAGEWKPSK